MTKKAVKKTTSTVPTSSGNTLVLGGEYKPGMWFNKTMDRKTRSEFSRLRRTYHATGSKAATVDNQGSKHMLEDTKVE